MSKLRFREVLDRVFAATAVRQGRARDAHVPMPSVPARVVRSYTDRNLTPGVLSLSLMHELW